ncbi:secreted RxLR effector protein 161-like [Vicia villosa]|uniref:secreted RxLR effector protein 161-like n=1 Tax=Vicia villosa TaxID=3911 RepID=UPI00273C39FC|nr:secreted RxLR effector protein 161-like [Vicia villosa]
MKDWNPASSLIEPNVKLEKHGEEDKVNATLFKQIIGSLRYVCNSRPDIGFAVELVSRYMSEPRVLHMKAARRILIYLKGSINCGILFRQESGGKEAIVNYFSDVDWCGDKEDRRSTTGYFFQVFGAPISWCLKKQPVVALSSCEAEYIAGSYVACRAIWIRTLLEEMEVEVKKSSVLQIDNMSAINLVKNPVLHGRSKHVEARFYFLREKVNRGESRFYFLREKVN